MRNSLMLALALGAAVAIPTVGEAATYAVATYDVPGAASTTIAGINDSGQLYGTYRLGSRTLGFIATAGTINTIDPSSAATSVAVGKINNAGQVAGSWVDPR